MMHHYRVANLRRMVTERGVRFPSDETAREHSEARQNAEALQELRDTQPKAYLHRLADEYRQAMRRKAENRAAREADPSQAPAPQPPAVSRGEGLIVVQIHDVVQRVQGSDNLYEFLIEMDERYYAPGEKIFGIPLLEEPETIMEMRLFLACSLCNFHTPPYILG